jgi:ATP-binding cassette subfamily B protein
VLSRLTTDTTLVQTVVGSSLSMGLRNTVMGLGALAMLVVTNPYVMTQVLGILVLVVLPSLYFGRRVRKLSRASQDRVADSSAIAAEVLNAIPVVQSYVQAGREAARFASHRKRLRHGAQAHPRALDAGGLHHHRHLRRAAVGPVPGHAGGDGRRHQRRPPGADGGVRDHPGGQRGGAVRGVRRPAARRRRHRAADGTAGGTFAGGRCHRATAAAPNPRRLRARTRGRHLPLPVAPAAGRRCGDFTLHVQPGDTVALVGPSGAGKSTVLQLLLRFYDAQQGTVRIDGVPVRDAALAALRQRMGIVPQDSTIFSTSALENIRYGRPAASDAEVEAAARAAFAHDFISRPARGLRHLPGRAWRAAVGRPAPAHQHRPRDAEEPAAAAAGRSHQRARRRERTHGAGRAGGRDEADRTTWSSPTAWPPC